MMEINKLVPLLLNEYKNANLSGVTVGTFHDSLLITCSLNDVEEVIKINRKVMPTILGVHPNYALYIT